MSKSLEILAAKTDAMRAAYLIASQAEQTALSARLNQIVKDSGEVTAAPSAAPVYTAKPQKRRGRPANGAATGNVSDIAKSRALQGKYIATVRQFPAPERAAWSAMAKEIGRKKTIAAMKQALQVRKAASASGV